MVLGHAELQRVVSLQVVEELTTKPAIDGRVRSRCPQVPSDALWICLG